MGILRPPIEQTFFTVALTALSANNVPIAQNINISSLINAFIICNPSSNVNSVFWGDSNVSTSSGIEIPPGNAPLFGTEEIRQLYELQDPLLLEAQKAICGKIDPIAIPVVVWNPSNIFIIAANANVNVSLAFFRNVYI